jgi:hypothetical protein
VLGGDLGLPFMVFLTLAGATVEVDGRLVVKDKDRNFNRPFGCFRYGGWGGAAGSSVVIPEVGADSGRRKRSIWWDPGLWTRATGASGRCEA